MKKRLIFSNLAVAALATAMLIFASCEQSANSKDDGTVTGSKTSASSTRMVTISLADSPSTGIARTILPTVSQDVDSYGKIMLEGTSALGGRISENIKSSFSGNPPKAQVELAATYWELTLTAYGTDDTTKLLEGRQNVDLSNGVHSITFYLSKGNLTNPGSIDISGNFTTYSSDVTKYRVGIYDLMTGAPFGTPSTGDVTVVSGTTEYPYSYTDSDIDPGSYLFAFELLDATGDILMKYSDTLVVMPGVPTKKTDFDIADYMDHAPAKPSQFTAEWVKASACDTDTDDYYDVEFNWKDNSDNELYFILELEDADDDTKKQHFPSQDGDANLNATLKSGSMGAGSTTCTLSLPTGKQFKAQIRAKGSKNFASDWAALASDEDLPAGYPRDLDTYGLYRGDGTYTINLVHWTYNLNGGDLSIGANSYTDAYHKFAIWEGSDIQLLKIDGTSNTLTKGTAPDALQFSWWKDSNGNKVSGSTPTSPAAGTGGFVAAPTGFCNAAFTAVFPTADIELDFNSFTDIDVAEVLIETTSGPALEDHSTSSVHAYKLELTPTESAAMVQITLNDPTATAGTTAYTYTNHRLYVDGAYKGGGTNTFSLDSTSMNSGTYQVLVLADKNGTTYGYRFELTITR